MLEVFICEDDDRQRNQLANYVQDYVMMEALDTKLTLATPCPKALIEYIKENPTNGLYFLDVNLATTMNGIQLAVEIRKYAPRCALVFITTHPELMELTFAYKVEAMDYINKADFEIVKQRVGECIQMANQRLIDTPNKKMLQFKTESKIITEAYTNIMFFETSAKKHKIVLHARNRQVEFYGKLNEIEEMDDCLFRCHRSFVINKENIAEVNVKNGEIKMVNGEICYASIRQLKKLLTI